MIGIFPIFRAFFLRAFEALGVIDLCLFLCFYWIAAIPHTPTLRS